jgi:hypothetical protein
MNAGIAMSDIQRYVWTNRIGEAVASEDGPWVTYADHVAAVAAAVQSAVDDGYELGKAAGYEQGQRDGRSDALREVFGDLSIEEFVAEAELNGRLAQSAVEMDAAVINQNTAYQKGYDKALADAVAAVEALVPIALNSLRRDGSTPSYDVVKVADAIAAIKGVSDE